MTELQMVPWFGGSGVIVQSLAGTDEVAVRWPGQRCSSRSSEVIAEPKVPSEPPVGFEPTTPALQERCSGQLS